MKEIQISINQSSKTLTIHPDFGFGSNQVDFGGKINPASATLKTSSTYKGYIAKPILQSS